MHRRASLLLIGLILALAGLPAPTRAQATFPVAGEVRFSDNQPVAGAKVLARRTDAFGTAQAITSATGAYSMTLDAGQWQLQVETPPDLTPWMFVDRPTSLDLSIYPPFAPVNFTVSRTQALVVGRVLDDTGAPLPPPAPGAGVAPPAVKIYSSDNLRMRRAPLDATGTFTAPLVGGVYYLQAEFDATYYKAYEQLPPTVRTVPTSGTLKVGNLLVLLQNATLAGLVRQPDGVGVPGVLVQAVRADGGSSITSTDAGGRFAMSVAAGTWEVSALADVDAFVSAGSSATVEAAANVTTTVTLTLEPAAGLIDGTLVLPDGSLAADARGWAYARDASGAIVAYAGADLGRFTLRVPAGKLRVGILLPADSPYTSAGEAAPALATALARGDLGAAQQAAAARAPFEQSVTVSPLPAGAAIAATTSVKLPLLPNDRRITGVVRDPRGRPLPGGSLLVTAAPASSGAAPQMVAVDKAGAFELNVSAGTWELNYLFEEEADGFADALPEPITVVVGSQKEVVQNLDLLVLDGVVRGVLEDEAGAPLAGQQVWVTNGTYDDGAESEEDGSFSIPVPLAGGQPTPYQLFVDGDCATGDDCLLDLGPLDVLAEPLGAPRALQNTPGQIYQVSRPRSQSTVTIAGKVRRNGGVNGLSVQPDFNDSKGKENGTTDTDGDFTVKVFYKNKVSKVYGKLRVVSKGELGKFELNGVDVSIQSIQQAAQAVAITMAPVAGFPKGVAADFSADQGWSYTLSDGMTVRIPPDAVPGGGLVRVVVEPTLDLPTDVRFTWGATYGYRVRLYSLDQEGKQITGQIGEPLAEPVELTLPYSLADLAGNDAAPGRLSAARLDGTVWAPAELSSVDADFDRFTVQTTALGTWALMQERYLCAGCLSLPIVWAP